MLANRNQVIELLKSGEEMIETQWGGYQYSIANFTVRFDTARFLMKNKLVVESIKERQSALLRYFKWNKGKSVYGHQRLVDEPMYKLTLRWIKENLDVGK